MRKFISLMVFVTVLLSFVSVGLSQEGKLSDTDSYRMQMGMMGRDWREPDIGRRSGSRITPMMLAQFDEDTRAAWREIEEMKTKRQTHIYIAIAAAFAIAIAAAGGAIGQGKVAASAMDGIARNPEAAPKLFTPLMISLALIESLVIYALVVAVLLQGKL